VRKYINTIILDYFMAKKSELTTIAVLIKDKEKLVECRNILIRDNPHLEGMKITDYFLMNRMVKWFLKPRL